MLNPPRRNIKDIVTQVNEMNSNSLTYKNVDVLSNFLNEQGKILPRRLTGTSLKYQRKVSVAVKRARHLALMPYVADMLK